MNLCIVQFNYDYQIKGNTCRFCLHQRFKAGVCRPCDTIELTATSCNFSFEKVCVDWQLLRNS